MRSDDQGRRLCSATAKSTGQPCRAPAVAGATICRMHGAAKGTPGRDAADNVMMSQLVGPAMWRLKGLIDSKDTPPAVVLGAIREILDRTNYRHEPTFEELRPDMDRLLREIEADMTPEELADRRNHA